MPIYRYQAIDDLGRTIKGSIEADDEHSLYRNLKERGLLLKKSSPVKGKAPISRTGLKSEELSQFSHQMAYIIRSGIPILEGIEEVKKSIRDIRFRSILESVIRDVSSGDGLAQAMARYPNAFPQSYVAVIQAGETAGSMEESFRDMGEYLEWVTALKRQVKQALFYPMIVLFIISIAMVIFVAVVIPRLVKFILELNRPLPFTTKMLVYFNDFILKWWPFMIVVGFASIFFILFLRRYERVRHFWDQYKLKIPILGKLLKNLVMLRFVKYLRIMYHAGIQIHQSFEILREVVGNLFFRKKMEQIRNWILEGESLANSVERAEDFPSLLERSIRVGETTGSIEGTLQQMEGYFGREIENNLRRIVSMIEPILLMFIGGVLLIIILSVLWPIYSIIGELG
jgi:type IV pilus assembly protein PilC